MKALINKMLVFAVASITLMFVAPVARAQFTSQLEEKTIPVAEFTGLDVSDDFEITLSKGACAAKVSVDKMLSPYVQVYVRGKVLYITYDSKAVPKDVRQMYKGRNAAKPVFRASISMEELSSVSIRDNVVLTCVDELGSKLSTDIDVEDKAQIKNLNVNANAVSVNIRKNAQVALNVVAGTKAELKADGNSNLKAGVDAHDVVASALGSSDLALSATGENATISCSGSAQASVVFKGTKAVVNTTGSADLELSGKGERLSIDGDKSSTVEAGGFDAKEADVDLNGPVKANITVQDSLEANLTGGSTLYYSGTPTFNIGKIIKSTLAPFGTK